VYKNSDSALLGTGDVDSVAPDSAWPVIEREFLRWAGEYDLGPVVLCNHIPWVLFLIAAPPQLSTFLEMDVSAGRTWRGSRLFGMDDLGELIELDSRGFRRLRPGAEGLFKLAFNGIRWSGIPDRESIRAQKVVDLLRRDPEGVRLAARACGLPTEPALRTVDRLLRGGWDYPAICAIQARVLLAGLRHPRIMLERVGLTMSLRMKTPPCIILETMFHGKRRIPRDRNGWLRGVERTHDVNNLRARITE
ncbi:MAG: hypothetical protein H0U86_16245, partial [Chloroflexi bacterium]|nr:hypothetical protein [Chloroflexota bacterium]